VIAPNAATAVDRGDRPERPRQAKLLRHIPTATAGSATIGFVDIDLASGTVLKWLRLMRGKRRPWLRMPSYRVLDKDGQWKPHLVGKLVHAELIEFPNIRERFTEFVFELIRLAHPEALQRK